MSQLLDKRRQLVHRQRSIDISATFCPAPPRDHCDSGAPTKRARLSSSRPEIDLTLILLLHSFKMGALVFGPNSLALPPPREENARSISAADSATAQPILDADPRLGVNIAGRVALWLIELLIHDFPDGASTASATNSATETNVDRARGTALHYPRDSSHLLVGQYVAGANNHRKMAPAAGVLSRTPRVHGLSPCGNVNGEVLAPPSACSSAQLSI